MKRFRQHISNILLARDPYWHDAPVFHLLTNVMVTYINMPAASMGFWVQSSYRRRKRPKSAFIRMAEIHSCFVGKYQIPLQNRATIDREALKQMETGTVKERARATQILDKTEVGTLAEGTHIPCDGCDGGILGFC